MILLSFLLGCAREPASTADALTMVEPLDAPRLLRRMSLDLRGVLPSTVELDAVESDPSRVDTYRDEFLQDARLEGRIVAMYAETWRTLVDDFDIEYFDYHLDATQEYTFERSVGEEPLRLIAYVTMNDLPWSEVVLADYTRANDLLAGIWPLDYPTGATGWQVARYTDGRPAVGVLASNGLWWRYSTSLFNENRGRANAISRLLLCQDMLSRPVVFSSTPSLLDDSATTTALATDDHCLACHAAIEPLAANLFGFYPNEANSVIEQTYYHPERELMGAVELGVQPAWYGTPVGSLRAMAEALAVDPRFARCAATTAATLLWRREPEVEDYDRVEALLGAFRAGGERMRPLLAAVTDTPEYRAGGLSADADADTEARERTLRLLSPAQLDTVVTDLTGFHWERDGYEQLLNDRSGYRVLVGGVNGENVLTPQAEPGLTWALVLKRLAEAAGSYAVNTELTGGATGAGLFAGIDLTMAPGDAAFDTKLAELHWRLFAVRASEARLDADRALWSAIAAQEGPEAAWAGLVSALLRDPDFVAY